MIDFSAMRKRAESATAEELRALLAEALDALAQHVLSNHPLPQPIVIPMPIPTIQPQKPTWPSPWDWRYHPGTPTYEPFIVTCSMKG